LRRSRMEKTWRTESEEIRVMGMNLSDEFEGPLVDLLNFSQVSSC
jgi:hypothetical protein